MNQMDPRKELAVLKYATAIWKRDVTDILDLQDGSFFLHVLNLLDHDYKTKVNTDKNRLLLIKEFLQDFYGNSMAMEDFLHFDVIHNGSDSLEEIKMELAKIAVVLLGIGVLNKNRKLFMDAALQLPVELQNDVLDMIQSVVLPSSTEVVLTNKIEKTLRKVTRSSPPVLDIRTTDAFDINPDDLKPRTPCCKKTHAVNLASEERTPLRSNMSLLNLQVHEISSPFKSLNIKSPSSPSTPLVDFVQSPQLIQKAVLKQKDLELRKVHEQLSAEILLKEEVQLALRDCQSVCATQDAEIAKLQKRIQEVTQESQVELLELQSKYQQVEVELLSMKEKAQSLQTHKEILEKENLHQAEDISKLSDKVNCLETERSKYTDSLETIRLLEVETKSQELQLAHLIRSQSQWEEEKAAYNRNLKTAREINKRLRNELDELQAKQSDSSLQGESMDIVVDIQMGELKCQLKEAREKNYLLEKQLQSSKKEMDFLKKQLEQYNQQMKMMTETNSCLSNTLTIERDTIVKMKKRLEVVESNYKVIKTKLEITMKEKENSASELSSLKAVLQELEQQQQKHKQQPEFIDCCQEKSALEGRGHGNSILCLDEAVTDRNSTCSKRHTRNEYQEPDSNISTKRGLSTDLRSSTVSLHSILSLKEHLPEVLPNASSCENEPEIQAFDWDRLSQMSTSADKGGLPTYVMKDLKEDNPVKCTRTRTPMKRELADSTISSTSNKQRRSGGTVKYFPLDPKGPIYPPPHPSICTRRISGRFIPTACSTSSSVSHAESSYGTKDPHIARSTTSDTSGMVKLKSISSFSQSQKKYSPCKRQMGRLGHTYKYKFKKITSEAQSVLPSV